MGKATARQVVPGSALAWLLALRPRTLTLGVVPVLAGNGLALVDGRAVDPAILLLTVAASLCIVAATNLFNDAADGERGLDAPPQRLGPPRATASGWLPARQLRRAAGGLLALALACGFPLVARGGWPILLIGLAALLASPAYSFGRAHLSAGPAGEALVILFFGVLAVGGSYHLQAGTLTADALLCGLAIGMPAAAVLLVNNYRDQAADRQAGRRTLAVVLGARRTQRLYALLLLLPPALLAAIVDGGWRWLPLLAWPPALRLLRRLQCWPVSSSLNRLLAATARWQLLLGLLLGLAWYLQAPD